MDLSVLPEIFALGLLIVAFRPIARRVGAHVNIWFLAWMFSLAFFLTLLFTGGAHRPPSERVSMCFLELCGLTFMVAASSTYTRQIDWTPFAALAAPALLQACCYRVVWPRGLVWINLIPYGNNALLLAPLLFLLFRGERRRPLLNVSGAFAAWGLLSMPLAAAQPRLVTAGILTVIFFSASYLYVTTSRRSLTGRLLTGGGLAIWALRFPLLQVLGHYRPDVHLDSGLLQLPRYMVMAGSIVTLLEEYLQRTERMAMHDPLTDLPNRRLFEERFAAALEEAHEENTTVACLVIDVDNFKTINDTLGHVVGDGLLTALAVRLAWHMSPRDILARTGGDEFTAMLAGVTDEHHLRFVASAMMSAASVPVAVQGMSIDVRISVGISLSPDDADGMEDLLKSADNAMYHAKRRGGDRLVFAGDLNAEDPLPAPGLRETSARILRMTAASSPQKRVTQI